MGRSRGQTVFEAVLTYDAILGTLSSRTLERSTTPLPRLGEKAVKGLSIRFATVAASIFASWLGCFAPVLHAAEPAAQDGPEGTFQFLLSLPGLVADEIRLDVVSLGPGGLEIDGAGDPASIPGLPPTSLTGENGLVLRRQSADQLHDGHHLYAARRRRA